MSFLETYCRPFLKNLFLVWLFCLTTSRDTHAQLYLVKQAPSNKERIIAAYKSIWVRKLEDSAMQERFIDSVQIWAKAIGDEQLYNYMEIFSLYLRAYDINTDSIRYRYIQSRFAPLLKTGDKTHLAYFHKTMYNCTDVTKDPEKATYHFVNAENLFNEVGLNSLPLAPELAEDLASFYLRFENYATAIRYYTYSYEHSISPTIKHPFLLNNMGVVFIRMKEYGHALDAFEQLMKLEKTKPDQVYYGIACGNYGNVLRLLKRYQEALPYLYTDVGINEKGEPGNSAITCLYIANCLLHLDSIAKARHYLDLAVKLNNEPLNTSYAVNYFETNALYFKKTGNLQKVAFFQDTLIQLKDSLRYLFDNRVLMANSLVAKEEKLLAQQKQADLEVKNIQLVRNFSMAILLLVFGISLLLIYQRQQKQKRLASERQHEADEQLRHANEQLAHYLDNIREKNALIEKIELQLLYPGPTTNEDGLPQPMEATAVALTQQQLEQLHQSVIMTDDEWTAFKLLFEQVWPGFLQVMY